MSYSIVLYLFQSNLNTSSEFVLHQIEYYVRRMNFVFTVFYNGSKAKLNERV